MNSNMPSGYNQYTPQQIQSMYPDIYNELYPIITQAAENAARRGYPMTQENVGAIVDSIIKNSGMWDEDGDYDNGYDYDHFGDDYEGEAIPVIARSRGYGYRRRRHGHHNRNTLRDIVKILFLNELSGCKGYGCYRY